MIDQHRSLGRDLGDMRELAIEEVGGSEEMPGVDADDVGEAIDLGIAGSVQATQPFRDGRFGDADLARDGGLGFQLCFQMVER